MVRIPRYRGVKAERTVEKKVTTRIELTDNDVRRLLRLPPEAELTVTTTTRGGVLDVLFTLVITIEAK